LEITLGQFYSKISEKSKILKEIFESLFLSILAIFRLVSQN